jgi:maltooligosyltrehalose trehalohydrolase
MQGERLSTLVSFETLKLAAAMVILSPYLPLLFMGEEWGEPAPFQYFTSHSDADLITAVRRGRREEFASFGWGGEPPDPQDEGVFERCKIDHSLAQTDRGRVLWEFHQALLQLRRSEPALRRLSKTETQVRCDEKNKLLEIHRRYEDEEFIFHANFGEASRTVVLNSNGPGWKVRLDSADRRWGGPGSGVSPDTSSRGVARFTLNPRSFIALQRTE